MPEMGVGREILATKPQVSYFFVKIHHPTFARNPCLVCRVSEVGDLVQSSTKYSFRGAALYFYSIMKRSLAPPRRDKPTGGDGKKQTPVPPLEEKPSPGNMQAVLEMDQQDRIISQKFEEKYRNKNLNILSTQMLVALSGLKVLDISYNKLTDSQIELIMGSCTKLGTFCMQGNLTNLIPASISKLKALVNFRHDWVKLNPDDMYEPEPRLEKLKEIGKKPECLAKLNRTEGLMFKGYVQHIIETPFDQKLLEQISKCECSAYAKENMVRNFEEGRKLFPISETSPLKQKTQPQIKETALSDHMDNSLVSHETVESEKIDIEKGKSQASYFQPGFPLHNLFANFDRNHYAPAEIDGLLLKGYNPNQYDPCGFSPYHIIVMEAQRRGMDYLLEISSNNPGFFDLEMLSVREGRNILHYSVLMKNHSFTKLLISFGLPIDRRDSLGYRLVHLNEQNIEALILLRKLLRKRTETARNPCALTIPPIPAENKRNYIKHPLRQKEESRFRITYSRNDKLLEMFERAAGIPGI